MSLQIALPLIDEALGSSIIYDELKGNFAAARTLVETHLTAARQTGTAAQLAAALLACGVVHLLQGETLLADRYLQELATNADAVHQLRALTYANLAAVPGPCRSSAAQSQAPLHHSHRERC